MSAPKIENAIRALDRAEREAEGLVSRGQYLRAVDRLRNGAHEARIFLEEEIEAPEEKGAGT